MGLVTVLLTTHLIGDLNRSRVLQAFCDHGPLSQIALVSTINAQNDQRPTRSRALNARR